MCEENYFYNRSAPGCQQCPSCYSLVRDKVRAADTLVTDRRKVFPAEYCDGHKQTCCFSLQVNQQRQKLHELQTLIDNLGSGQETVSDKAFEDRLKEAERAIVELLEEAQTSKGNAGSTSGSESAPASPFLRQPLMISPP